MKIKDNRELAKVKQNKLSEIIKQKLDVIIYIISIIVLGITFICSIVNNTELNPWGVISCILTCFVGLIISSVIGDVDGK